jgi:hypothetical protein
MDEAPPSIQWPFQAQRRTDEAPRRVHLEQFGQRYAPFPHSPPNEAGARVRVALRVVQ